MSKQANSILFIFLFFFSVVISLLYGINKSKTSFLTLTQNYSKSAFTMFKTGELLSGDKITGEFKASQNNLGIIQIRFLTYGRVNADSFAFRLKEKGASNWHYENTYKAREFGGYPLFPFGFPIITNSKDKFYYFELESLYGKSTNAVGISFDEPIMAVKYKFTKEQLTVDKRELLAFVSKKTLEILQDTQVTWTFLKIYFFSLVGFFVIAFLSPLTTLKLMVRKSALHSRLKLQKQSKKLKAQSKERINFLAIFFYQVGERILFIVKVIIKILNFLFTRIIRGIILFQEWLRKD